MPALGATRLVALQPDALARLYAAKLASGLAPRSVRHIHVILHTALAEAVRWGTLARNPADLVTPPKVPARELQPPPAAAVGRLLEATKGHRLHARTPPPRALGAGRLHRLPI